MLDFRDLSEMFREKLQGIFPSGRPNGSEIFFTGVSADVAQPSNDIARRELIAKLVSTLIGAAVSIGITYVGVKFLMNAIDPTQKEKLESQKRVPFYAKKI